MNTPDNAPPGPAATVETHGPAAWIRLARPDSMNALSREMLDGLNDAIEQVGSDRAARVVVVTGTGKAFCAGADLKGLGAADGSVDPAAIVDFVKAAGATLQRLASLDKPVIAAVNGLALAGGLELVLVCDLVIAARSARLGDAHANYGLLPGGGGAARLPRVVGPTVAKYLAFTGQFMPAADLVPLGLVNEVVNDDELYERVEELAGQIAAKSSTGLAHMKRLIDDGLDQPLPDALRLEHEALATHSRSPDFLEGLAAFRDKRQPTFE